MAPAKATRQERSAKPVKPAKSPKPVKSTIEKPEVWKLRLYVAGQSPKSIRAFANLKILCEQHLKGRYRIEVVDLLENPQMARGGQIVALPALVVKLPQVVRQIIGDLSNSDRVLIGLALQKVVA
jgi:circadian clock protein KaiB